MPIINVKISGQVNKNKRDEIIELILNKTENILQKKRELCAICLQFIDKENWSIGGFKLVETEKNSFYLNIKITDETNLKAQKAQYINELYDGFAKIMGNIDEKSYIHVEDVRAAAYGFGGKTQEYRFHN